MSVPCTLPTPRVVFHIGDFNKGSARPLCGAIVSHFVLGIEAASSVNRHYLCPGCAAALESRLGAAALTTA